MQLLFIFDVIIFKIPVCYFGKLTPHSKIGVIMKRTKTCKDNPKEKKKSYSNSVITGMIPLENSSARSTKVNRRISYDSTILSLKMLYTTPNICKRVFKGHY